MKKTYVTPAMVTVRLSAPVMLKPISIVNDDSKTVDDPTGAWSFKWESTAWEEEAAAVEEEYYDEF